MVRDVGEARVGAIHRLLCHPATPAKAVSAVTVQWSATDENEVLLTFAVENADAVVVPQAATPNRADDLWRTTCFEMFWRESGADGYVEINLSPSGRWAAYGFDRYREGMQDHPMAVDPHIACERATGGLTVDADIDLAIFSRRGASVALSAVIEETDGTKSYWALRHPPGPPDFHHPDCFALELPALDCS